MKSRRLIAIALFLIVIARIASRAHTVGYVQSAIVIVMFLVVIGIQVSFIREGR